MSVKFLSTALAAGLILGVTGIASAQNDVQQKSGQTPQVQKTMPGSGGTEAGSRTTEPGTKQENRAAGDGPTSTSGQAPMGAAQPATGGMKKPDEQKK